MDKVLNKASTDIPATQEGLIQIYDIMGSDFSEFTVLCICTLPGWYNVCFDDWYEIFRSIDGFEPYEVFEMKQTSTKVVGQYANYDPKNYQNAKEPIMCFRKVY